MANLENADLSEADLTGSRWFAVNVSGADFSDVTTTDAHSRGVNWSNAKFPPAETPEPSTADTKITQRLKEALALVDVRVLDHVIVGTDGTSSMAEAGLL